MEKITVNDIITFLELNKIRAELSFKLALVVQESEQAAQIKEKLESVQSQITKISSLMDKAGIVIAVPNESEIATLNGFLSDYSAKEIHEAMKTKNGEIYGKLVERGKLIKQNFENRQNIAKLSLFIAGFPKQVKEAIVNSIKAGSIESSIPLINVETQAAKKAIVFLARIGINAKLEENSIVEANETDYEIEMELPNKRVWIPAETKAKLDDNLQNLNQISSKIQLKNAVRQIKEFSDEEEKEFVQMQDAYLKLLKEQDELLKDFLDEEKIFREI